MKYVLSIRKQKWTILIQNLVGEMFLNCLKIKVIVYVRTINTFLIFIKNEVEQFLIFQLIFLVFFKNILRTTDYFNIFKTIVYGL